jgi:hypothetical protein
MWIAGTVVAVLAVAAGATIDAYLKALAAWLERA